jgi:hypothetical protein
MKLSLNYLFGFDGSANASFSVFAGSVFATFQRSFLFVATFGDTVKTTAFFASFAKRGASAEFFARGGFCFTGTIFATQRRHYMKYCYILFFW